MTPRECISFDLHRLLAWRERVNALSHNLLQFFIPVRSKTEGVDEDLAVDVDEGLQGGHIHLAEDISKLVILIFKDFNIFRIFLK